MRRHLFYITFLMLCSFLSPLMQASEKGEESEILNKPQYSYDDGEETLDDSLTSEVSYSDEDLSSQSTKHNFDLAIKRRKTDSSRALEDYPITAVPSLLAVAAEVVANNLRSYMVNAESLRHVCNGLNLDENLEDLIIRNIAIPPESFLVKYSLRGDLVFKPGACELAQDFYGAAQAVQEVLKRFLLCPKVLSQKIPKLRLEKFRSNPVCPVIPGEIRNMTKTTEFHVLNFNLESLPPEMKEMKMLKNIYFENCKLSSFPNFIFELKHLTVVRINASQIKILPPDIGRLSQLMCLDLSRNQIEVLPGDIGRLTSLQDLNLSDNFLKTLPMQIGNLVNLIKLSIFNNRLETLPFELLDLYKLEYFKAEIEGVSCSWDEQGQSINKKITARMPGSKNYREFLRLMALVRKGLPANENLQVYLEIKKNV
jgi:hypothetical protein